MPRSNQNQPPPSLGSGNHGHIGMEATDGGLVSNVTTGQQRSASQRAANIPPQDGPEQPPPHTHVSDMYIAFRRQLPSWARFASIGHAPGANDGSLQSQLFHSQGGPELLARLCSDDVAVRQRAETVILGDLLSTAVWTKKRVDMELAVKLNQGDVSIADEGVLPRLLELSEIQAARIESTIRIGRSVGQVGPLNLVVKGGSAPQQNNIRISTLEEPEDSPLSSPSPGGGDGPDQPGPA